MGVNDYHVSDGTLIDPKMDKETMDKYRQIYHLAYMWDKGLIETERFAETVFGIVNKRGELVGV